jgi:hypothetical protein
MKKGFLIYGILMGVFSMSAQEKKKDTIVATEIVNVVTKYNPKIADAEKINNNPKITLLKKSNKKKLKYSIFSAPVASTFIPKSGAVKGINVGVKERIYNNYLAAGYGNYDSPYAELFIYKNTRFNNEFGIHAKYNASEANIKNSVLNSNFLNFNMATFFKQEERFFDWKVSIDAAQNNYNWYGLQQDKAFTENTINAIDEAQNYRHLKLAGDFKFYDSYVESGKVVVSYFTDEFKSAEVLLNLDAELVFPLDFLSNNLNEIAIHTGIEFLKGSFENNYANSNKINYNLITAKLIPEYTLEYLGVSMKARLKTFISLDTENDVTNFFLFPELLLQTNILKKHINGYVGFTGDLETNTYQKFAEENPYVSPTIDITQTAESSNFFAGFKGNITRNLNYNIKATVKNEENKPLFLRNNSKSNGTTTTANGQPLKGYEFGNSFRIFYDDVKSTSIFAEVEYLFDKNLTFRTHIKYDNYTTTTALESWNLPNLQVDISAKYSSYKWYATSNIYYVGERTDALYTATFPSSIQGAQTLNSFVDVNLNGGYHFNDKFSAFLSVNNVLNTTYQRFANFNTQGFQALAGLTYKFDF